MQSSRRLFLKFLGMTGFTAAADMATGCTAGTEGGPGVQRSELDEENYEYIVVGSGAGGAHSPRISLALGTPYCSSKRAKIVEAAPRIRSRRSIRGRPKMVRCAGTFMSTTIPTLSARHSTRSSHGRLRAVSFMLARTRPSARSKRGVQPSEERFRLPRGLHVRAHGE